MAREDDFLPPKEHYDALVSQLDPTTLITYQATRHARTETGYSGRQFIIYRMGGGAPQELTRLLIEALGVDDYGLFCKVSCMRTQRERILRYEPRQLWDYPIFMMLPLHAQVRFATTAKLVGQHGSLAWPMVIRTKSRRDLREPGVTYCEATTDFAREFDQPHIA